MSGYDYVRKNYPHLLAQLRQLSLDGAMIAMYGVSDQALRYATASTDACSAVIQDCMVQKSLLYARADLYPDFRGAIEAWDRLIGFLGTVLRPILEAYEGSLPAEEEIPDSDVDAKMTAVLAKLGGISDEE